MLLPLRSAYVVHKQKQIPAYDTVGSRINGRWTISNTSSDRMISCIIQPITNKTTNLLPEGMKSDQQMIMQTDFPIYVTDVSQIGTVSTQTYVRYMGDIWRAWAVNSIADKNGGITMYILERYVAAI